MANPWMTHLGKVRKANKGKSLKQCMVLAKKSYKKGGKKGGSIVTGGKLKKGGSIVTGGKLKKKRKRRGGLFKPTSKRRSDNFSKDVFEAGAVVAGTPLAPMGVAMMGGAAIGSGIVNLLDSIF